MGTSIEHNGSAGFGTSGSHGSSSETSYINFCPSNKPDPSAEAIFRDWVTSEFLKCTALSSSFFPPFKHFFNNPTHGSGERRRGGRQVVVHHNSAHHYPVSISRFQQLYFQLGFLVRDSSLDPRPVFAPTSSFTTTNEPVCVAHVNLLNASTPIYSDLTSNEPLSSKVTSLRTVVIPTRTAVLDPHPSNLFTCFAYILPLLLPGRDSGSSPYSNLSSLDVTPHWWVSFKSGYVPLILQVQHRLQAHTCSFAHIIC